MHGAHLTGLYKQEVARESERGLHPGTLPAGEGGSATASPAVPSPIQAAVTVLGALPDAAGASFKQWLSTLPPQARVAPLFQLEDGMGDVEIPNGGPRPEGNT